MTHLAEDENVPGASVSAIWDVIRRFLVGGNGVTVATLTASDRYLPENCSIGVRWAVKAAPDQGDRARAVGYITASAAEGNPSLS